jgi:hypothetical protein
MRLISTGKALDELSSPVPALDARQHTLLLLANGQRSLSQLSALVGEDLQAEAEQLQHLGYLAPIQVQEPLPDDPPLTAPDSDDHADYGRISSFAALCRGD